MAFEVFTDSCSNLPGSLIDILNIHTLNCSYTIDGKVTVFNGNISEFDSHGYYDGLRAGKIVHTSLINAQSFIDVFEPVLAGGKDIVYIGLSAGISGTMQASFMASQELKAKYPDREIRLVDSMGAGLGTGLLACRAADLRNEGKSLKEAGDILDALVPNLCEYFIVDDLRFLARTGRVSGAAALVGNMLHIMPILRGDETGHIVAEGKHRGRKKATQAILDIYKSKVVDPRSQRIAITHGDCPEEAEKLAKLIMEAGRPRELIVCPHEPFTGAHVGPGMLALFFFGNGR